MTIKFDAARLVREAEAVWDKSAEETVGKLRLALNWPCDGAERLLILQSYIVHNEWLERMKRGLPPYHALDTNDLGFKFTDLEEYDSLAAKYQTPPKIMGAYSLEDPGENMGEWAKVHTLREPPPGPLAWLACDGKYFELFGAVLLRSLKGTPVHLHLMDADKTALDLIDSTDTYCGVSIEKPEADKNYYHAVRFIRFAEDLARFDRQMWLLDVDAVANLPPQKLPHGLSARLRPGRLEAWNQINACVVGGDPNSLPYFRKVGAFINKNRDNLHWGIDQLALYCVWERERPELTCLGPKQVDYDYQGDGVIWCNSGGSKFRHIAGDKLDRPAYQEKFNWLKQQIGSVAESARARTALASRDFEKAQEHLLRSMDLIAHESLIEPLDRPPANPKNKIGKYIYLPVEMAGRELASRAWIAGECAKLGFNVVLGATWNMADYKWRDWPPGIVLFKTLYALDAKNFWAAKSLAGHQVAVLDEEMLPLALNKRIYEFSCEAQALHLADLICAPGEASAAILREMAPGKVVVTGNPRAMARKERTGGKILVCTSAPMINPTIGFDANMKMTLRVAGKEPKGEVLEIWREQIKHEVKWTKLQLEALEALREKYGERVVVRPHPAEAPSTFGLEADHETLSSRLAQADCVVFVSSCGIGIEAGMAGVPAVRIGSGGDGLSASFGALAESTEDVLAQVEDCLAGKQPIPDLTGLVTRDITLPQELEKLWRRNAYEMDFDLVHAYQKQRNVEYVPGEFEKNKFPETTEAQISEMVGLPVTKVGWNLYVIPSVSKGRSAGSVAA